MAQQLSVSASKPKVMHPSESILFGADFTKLLVANETLSGTPTVTDASGLLTISAVAINAATFVNDDGVTVAINCGVQFRVVATNGVAGTTYPLKVQCATNQSNTRVLICNLQVQSS